MVVMFLAATPAMAASTVDVGSNNALFYDAASGQANQLTISGDGASLTVTDTGVDSINPGQGCAAVDLQTVTCAGADKIEVRARDLDDTVTLSTGLISLIYGQNGSDTLHGGSGLDILRGGEGDDALNGNDGPDVLVGEGGNDQMSGGAGSDTTDYGSSTSGVTVDLTTTVPQDTGVGLDALDGIENVNGSTTGGDVLTGDAAPNKFIGSGGGDVFHVAGGGSDIVNCGAGSDDVFPDRSDSVRYRNHPVNADTCEMVNDNADPSGTTITAGPSGPTSSVTPSWEFTSDEPWADFECAIVDNASELDTATWSSCRSGDQISAQPEGASRVFAVRAFDDQGNRDQHASREFTIDTIAPDTRIDSGPSGGGVTTNPTPEFSFSSDDPDTTGFLCRFDAESFFLCSSPLTANPPLADGLHTFEVAATDAAGNFDNTPAQVSFRVDTAGPGPAPGDGPAPNPQSPQSPQTQQTKIIIGSLVLISGNAVKMSRKGRISISLTCAGAVKCSGRLSITTAEPVSKRSRKLVTLGTKRFSIAGNKKRKISVKFSKRNMRLVKRLKRFKAKAVIREIDSRGNPRISSRLFILRAR
jgi:hypothetical protein